MELPKSISEYFEAKAEWRNSLLLLREIIVSTNVEETLKWGAPAYLHNGENIIGLAAYQNYVGIWFHQGVFLSDKAKVLFNANESKTKGLRQWRFANYKEVEANAGMIESYVLEAIENQKAGNKIKITTKKTLIVPSELNEKLMDDKDLQLAYNKLTNAKKIEFANYISDAKQAKTKQSRLCKIIPMVMKGEGLNDKYRK